MNKLSSTTSSGLRILCVICLLIMLPACNTLQTRDTPIVQSSNDPLEGFNRAVYKFNTAADKGILKPIARGYKNTIPSPARQGVRNFFDNLGEPLNVVNNLLQGKIDRSLQSTFRFVVNSTVGVLGLFDVADHLNVEEAPEDLGQTLASWGVGPGPYLMLPVLGPSNLRDGFSRGAESFAYYPNGEITESTGGQISLFALDSIDFRSRILGADEVLDAQLDPYGFLKSSFEQDRFRRIYDGNPPVDEEDQELDF